MTQHSSTNAVARAGWRKPARVAAIGTLAAMSIIAFLTVSGPGAAAARTPSSEPATAPVDAMRTAFPNGFADLVEQVKPAVVNISATKTGPGAGLGELPFQLPPGSALEDFFKRFFEQNGTPGTPREARSLGSGFIIDAAGHVVTNNHVIDGAEEVVVILEDGSKYPAELKGKDPKTDLALLKITRDEPFPHVALGDSDRVRPGDWVIAIGNPFGLGGTVTTGILSARGRDIQSGPYDDFLQVDAAINRGNSGGPLFDMHGRVVGINTAIFSPNGGSVGIGFAIPSNMAQSVLTQLVDTGRVDRAWLGVQIQSVTDDIAAGLGLDAPTGALVAEVIADSPAAKAGLEVGDVIVGYDGRPLEQMKALPRWVADTPAGRSVEIELLRHGKPRTVKVTLATAPDAAAVAAAPAGEDAAGTDRLGVGLAALTDDARQRLGIGPDVSGALVVQVEPGSPAARKGLKTGDVVMMVGQTRVGSPEQAAAAVKQASEAKRKAVLLLVNRQGNQQFVAVPLGHA